MLVEFPKYLSVFLTSLSVRCARKYSLSFLLLLSFLTISGNAYSHADGENYIWLTIEKEQVSGRFEISDLDVQSKLSIDLTEDVELADQEKLDLLKQYILDSFQLFDGDTPIELKFVNEQRLDERPQMIQLFFESTSNPSNHILNVRNSILLDENSIKKDRLHKSLVLIDRNDKIDKVFGDEYIALVFDSRKSVQELDTENPATSLGWKNFFHQGILHILYGFDHVLFVITLLLTSAMVFAKPNTWTERKSIKSTAWTAFKLLTVFTIAHSLTLTLSVLGLIKVNILVAEVIIVLSILVMALNNIRPVISHESLWLVFVFGLFHGVGFASVMNQLAFRNVFLDRVILLFNLGIEFGQLLIAIVIVPLVIFASRYSVYRTRIMQVISLIIAVIAAYWLLQRVGLLP